jgi:hypothetical protein
MMKPAKSLLCFAFLASATAAMAQTGNYFPLETGNSWMFRFTGRGTETSFRSISVEGRETLNDVEYFRVRYFERVVYLRSNADGSIVSFNRGAGGEEPWLKPNEPAGATFEAKIDQCVNSGRIEEKGAEAVTPSGRFADTVAIGFRGNCADAGTTRQVYAAGVGPVLHEETSFAGPRRYELIYFRAGGNSGGTNEVSFTMALDAARYQAGSNMAVRLTLRSTQADPITLHFPSGQSFDLKIHDSAGKIAYTWSADKFFILIIRDEQFGPGERTYGFPVPLGTLPPGRYKAQGYLTTSPQTYLAEIPFEIVP